MPIDYQSTLRAAAPISADFRSPFGYLANQRSDGYVRDGDRPNTQIGIESLGGAVHDVSQNVMPQARFGVSRRISGKPINRSQLRQR
jgi:hypothetical protein